MRGLVSSPVLDPLPSTGWTPAAAAHLLNRAGFGGAPAEILRFHALGHRGAVAALLGADEEGDLFPPPELELMASRMQEVRSIGLDRDQQQARLDELRKEAKGNTISLRGWWLCRMRETPNPAREKATLFWHGHWATGIRKVKDPLLMLRQNETLRAHALGPFAPLAKEMTRDPAMIQYLDLQSSSANRPNENFAREVMELFTLGEGNYSEADVAEAARAFTGYRIDKETGRFVFKQRQTDTGVKSFLGQTGRLTGDDVIDAIVADPRCPEFLAAKLWIFYVGPPPSETLRKSLGAVYRRCDMDTGKFLQSIFMSREFFAPGVVRHQIKSPVQWLVQMCKILEIPLPASKPAQSLLENLGQTLFEPPNVKGWDGGRAWISSSTLLVRYNTAGNIVRGFGGAVPDIDKIVPPGIPADELIENMAWRLFQSPMPPVLGERARVFLAENGTSPSARRDLLHLLMSTPEFQLV